MNEHTVPDPINWVECGLVASDLDGTNDHDVTDEAEARELAAELLGSERQVQRVDDLGWLVEFTDDEWAELEANGWFGRENDRASLEAEMP